MLSLVFINTCALLLLSLHSDKNPVFTYNETVLYDEMERIKEELGDPITVFLTSEEYKSCSVLDDGDDSDDDDDDDDSDDDDNPMVRLKYINSATSLICESLNS